MNVSKSVCFNVIHMFPLFWLFLVGFWGFFCCRCSPPLKTHLYKCLCCFYVVSLLVYRFMLLFLFLLLLLLLFLVLEHLQKIFAHIHLFGRFRCVSWRLVFNNKNFFYSFFFGFLLQLLVVFC